MNKSIIFAALAVIATAPVLADTPRLDQREANQAGRIYNGVASGELTRPEARRLTAGQVHRTGDASFVILRYQGS